MNPSDTPEPSPVATTAEESTKRKSAPKLLARHPSVVFLYAGLTFLLVSLCLFILGGWLVFWLIQQGPIIQIPEPHGESSIPATLTERDRYNFLGRILSAFLGPLLIFGSAGVCAFVGIRLLKSAGAVATHVIPPQDYELLATAIRDGNENAIGQYIRLSSLSGTTGTFTKIGLTGLPLATIFLTILLALLGIFVPKLLDLAQLTLGAFIGSYVQKKQTDIAAPK
jgi:hypothetical protein